MSNLSSCFPLFETDKIPGVGLVQLDTLVHLADDAVYVLSPFRDVKPLKDMQERATGFVGRRLLYTLLRLVSLLHSNSIYRLKICVDTVFCPNDVEIDVENLVVGGLTSISTDPRHAVSDCYQIFQLVRTLVGNRRLPNSWIGNETLDNLLTMSNDPRSAWTYSVQDVCQQIGTNLADKNELWSSVTAQRTLKFRLVPNGQNHYLRAEDVKNYLRLAAIIHLPGVINREKCRSICSMAFHALSHVERDGFIDIADYQVFAAHLKHRHDSDLGVSLALALPSSGISTRNLTIDLNMALKLPYQPHYGLVNL